MTDTPFPAAAAAPDATPAEPVWTAPPELPDHPYRFQPVPRAANRRDGWSSDRQHAFVAALARLPSVAAAARSVGMTARSAYRLRAAPGAWAFSRAWDDALEIGLDRARDTALDRAIDGEVVPVRYRGRIVGTRRRYNDRLLIATLANGKAAVKGLLDHQREIRFRRESRAADIRLGGPVDWGPTPAERAKADAKAAREYQAQLDELLSRPCRARPPRIRSL